MMQKDKLITFRLSEKEHESIVKSCKTEGVTQSELIRRAIKWRTERRI